MIHSAHHVTAAGTQKSSAVVTGEALRVRMVAGTCSHFDLLTRSRC